MKITQRVLKLMPENVKKALDQRNEKKEAERWKKLHRVKQLAIRFYQTKNNINILVETGTYLGDMVWAQLNNFRKIYSVELDKELWENAVIRFKEYNNVSILQGDSGKVLNEVVAELNEAAIFWLDGHYSGGVTAKGDKECPIYEELDAIFHSKLNHLLLIDDARCFNGTGDYPSIEDLSNYILANRPQSQIEVKDDIIRIELK
jgi:hypothetical protein